MLRRLIACQIGLGLFLFGVAVGILTEHASVNVLANHTAHGYDLPAPIPPSPGTQYRIVYHKGTYVSPNVRKVSLPLYERRSRFRAILPWVIQSVSVVNRHDRFRNSVNITVSRKGMRQ